MRRPELLVGPWIVLALSLVPVIFWAVMSPLHLRFASTASVLTSLGQVTGLVGMAMFSLSLILHARIRAIEGLFGGLDGVYRAHHLFGGLSFMLILFHPLFLVLRFLSISIRDAALFLLPGSDYSIDFGIVSLILLSVLLVITFYAKWKYHKWKLSHSFLALSFFLASLHVFFVSSDVSRSIPLRVYVMGLAAAGILSFVARKIFPQPNRYEYQVRSVRKLNSEVVEISLQPMGRAMRHLPGQFAFVSFWSKIVSKEWHPFSISSSPHEKSLRFTIRVLGDFTSGLPLLEMNDWAILEGPYGRFSCEFHRKKPQLWIAGGIGITPFLSMARSLASRPHGKRITLFYAVSSAEEAICVDELERISKRHTSFKVVLYLSNAEGRITAEKVRQKVKDLPNREVFICGPPPMMESLRKQFGSLGVKSVHTEEFLM